MANNILADLAIRLSTNTAALEKGLAVAKNQLNGFKGVVSNIGSTLSGAFKDASKDIGQSLNIMTGGISGVLQAGLTAFRGLTVGIKGFASAFAATGIGAIIMLVATALAGLVAAFKRSGSAADAMEKGLGFLKGILNYLVSALVKVGEWLVKAFSDPKTAIKELWTAIKDNLVTRFKGVVDIFVGGWEIIKNGAMGVAYAIKGIFSEDARKESKEYFQKMADGLKKTGEGIVALTTGKTVEEIKAIKDEMLKAGKEGARIAEMEDALDEKKRKVIVENGKLEIALADTKLKMADEDGKSIESKEKKQKLLNKAIEYQNIISANNVGLAKQEWDLILAQNKAKNDTSDDALMAAAEAELKYYQASANARTEIVNLKRKETGVDAKLEEDAKKAVEAAIEYANKLRALKQENAILEIKDAQKADETKLGFDRDELLRTSKTTEEQTLIWENYWAKLKKLQDEYGAEAKEKAKDIGVGNLEKGLDDTKKSYDEKLKLLQDAKAKEWVTESEYAEKKRQLDEAEKARKISNIQMGLDFAGQALNSIAGFQEAAMNRELAAAGDNEQKKEEIRKKYAKKQKALAIMEAIVGTSLAVINALQTKPFIPMGLIAGGMAAAAGAAQIAVIASTPLAKGGLAYGETLATVGEYPGARNNPEVIAPLDKLRSMLANPFGSSEVRFVIEQDKLVGILADANNKNIYF